MFLFFSKCYKVLLLYVILYEFVYGTEVIIFISYLNNQLF
jgi:hypothetical protein